MELELTADEIEMIMEDQECSLESDHLGGSQECEHLSECPADHFEEGTQEENKMRQVLLKKMYAIAGKERER